MSRLMNVLILFAVMLYCHAGSYAQAVTPGAPTNANGPMRIADRIRGAKKYPGLFTLFQDTTTGSVQLYIKRSQLGKEFIYQAFSMGGPRELNLNQNMIRVTWIFKIRRVFDRLEFAQENTNFYYDSTNAVSRAANVDVADAIFHSDRIIAEDSAGFLIAGDPLFLSERLDPIRPVVPFSTPPNSFLNLGGLNLSKSKYAELRSYPENTDVIVELAYDNPQPQFRGGRNITDARFNRIRFQHSFLEVPQNDYRPRFDDPRVGYFTRQVNDLTSKSPTPFRDPISRWYLKKKDPKAALSEPVEPIVWWVENTTPVELRQTIVDAGLKWNEAFEKAGFKNAVVMKIMPDTATWDPGDVRYNVIRWVSSDLGFAIGPSFTNPRTGQILGSDITIDWGMLRGPAAEDELFGRMGSTQINDSIEYLPDDSPFQQYNCTLDKDGAMQLEAGKIALEVPDSLFENESHLQKQFLYFLILHEIGHTLGLNHNMKASQMFGPDEINNKELTSKYGMVASVMDYPIINVALDPTKQGDFFTSKTGPYDWWAIEFGYTECAKDSEDVVLKRILSRSSDPKLLFGNDADDMRRPGNGIDPRAMVWDLTNDMVAYASDRFALVNKLMGKLKETYVKPGRSFAELRAKYNILNSQRTRMSTAVSRYIGGIYIDRSFPDEKTTPRPFTPVPAEYQKKAMESLRKYIFAPDAFDADTYLFPYLQMQRRGFNFSGNPENPRPEATVLNMQRNVLSFLLHPVTLQRISSSSLYGNTYPVADVFNDLNSAIFDADLNTNVNLYRQNLQTEYVRSLAAIVNSPPAAFDNAARAAALSSLTRIRGKLQLAHSTDAQSKAHRSALLLVIDRALVTR
jgi:hypothetical protein